MLEGSRAAVRRDRDKEEKWAGRDHVRWNKALGKGEGVLYVVLSAGWCSLPWHLCFVFPWSSSPAVLGQRGSQRGQSLLSCIAAKQHTAGSHDSHGRSFTCLVTQQHAMRLDASAGFRCVLLITCSVSVGTPVALPAMVTSIALAA